MRSSKTENHQSIVHLLLTMVGRFVIDWRLTGRALVDDWSLIAGGFIVGLCLSVESTYPVFYLIGGWQAGARLLKRMYVHMRSKKNKEPPKPCAPLLAIVGRSVLDWWLTGRALVVEWSLTLDWLVLVWWLSACQNLMLLINICWVAFGFDTFLKNTNRSSNKREIMSWGANPISRNHASQFLESHSAAKLNIFTIYWKYHVGRLVEETCWKLFYSGAHLFQVRR